MVFLTAFCQECPSLMGNRDMKVRIESKAWGVASDCLPLRSSRFHQPDDDRVVAERAHEPQQIGGA